MIAPEQAAAATLRTLAEQMQAMGQGRVDVRVVAAVMLAATALEDGADPLEAVRASYAEH